MTEPSQATADLTTYRIEGVTREGGVGLDVPLISHIRGNLWTGGVRPNATLPAEIEYVVSLYPWERYVIEPARTRRLEFVLLDTVNALTVLMLGTLAADFIARGPTLIHCQTGINRSALVATMAMMMSNTELTARSRFGESYYAGEAIDLLRERRGPAVLSNAVFETWLRDEGEQLT